MSALCPKVEDERPSDRVRYRKKKIEKEKEKIKVLWRFYPFYLLEEVILPNDLQNRFTSPNKSVSQVKV